MRLHEIITEKRIDLDPERGMEVWENPSAAQLRSLLDQFGELRGGAGPDESLYVWDANAWVHHTIQKYVGYLPYYLYFSRTRAVRAEEWASQMRRRGSIFVGIKYTEVEDSGREKARPDVVLAHPMVMRAIQAAAVKESFVHGSTRELPVGTILKPQPDYLERWGGSFVYQTLERYRPAQCLPHEQSVFMVRSDSVDDIYHSGGPRAGYLFTVEPIGRVEKHNIAWLDNIHEASVGGVTESWDMDGYDDEDEAPLSVAEMARNYWLGVPHDTAPDTWEFVAPAARIVAVEPYEV